MTEKACWESFKVEGESVVDKIKRLIHEGNVRRIVVQHEGRTWPHYGRFLRIDRPRKVEYTWVSEATKGLESIVAITFEPRGSQTEVTLRHTGVPDDDLGRQHKDGWTWMLSMLAERFASRAPAPA